jgi:hypothetical protein
MRSPQDYEIIIADEGIVASLATRASTVQDSPSRLWRFTYAVAIINLNFRSLPSFRNCPLLLDSISFIQISCPTLRYVEHLRAYVVGGGGGGGGDVMMVVAAVAVAVVVVLVVVAVM